LVIDGNYSEASLVEKGDSIEVHPGKRSFSVVWNTINDVNFTAVIKPNTTFIKHITFAGIASKITTSSYQLVVKGYNIKVNTDLGSSIYIDGAYAGKHAVASRLQAGKHTVKITHPKYGSLIKKVKVSRYSTTEFSRYNKNPSKLPFVAKLVPGLEYLATKRIKKAGVTYVLLGALTANLIIQNKAYNDRLGTYNKWINLYEQTTRPTAAIEYRIKAKKENTKLKSITSNFNISLIATGIVSLFSVIDGLHKPKGGYKWSRTDKTNFTIEKKRLANYSYPAFQLKWRFE
jgi:hypothetical protein